MQRLTLYGLSSTFAILKRLDCINIQWSPRMLEPGTFELQLRAQDWDRRIAYVWIPDRKRDENCGIVEKFRFQNTVKGRYLLISGCMATQMLNWIGTYDPGVTPPKVTYENTGAANALCKSVIERYTSFLRLPYTRPVINSYKGTTPSDTITLKSDGGKVGDMLYAGLKTINAGQYLPLNPETGEFSHVLRASADYSDKIIFGVKAKTALEMDASIDASQTCNNLIVGYGSDGALLSSATSGSMLLQYFPPTWAIPRDYYMTSDLEQNPGESLDDYRIRVIQDAQKAAYDGNSTEFDVSITVDQTKYEYLTDYWMGQIVGVEATEATPKLAMLISGVDEVWKESHQTISVILSDVYNNGTIPTPKGL